MSEEIKGKKILLAYYSKFDTCPRPKRLYKYFSKNNVVDILSKDRHRLPVNENHCIFLASESKFQKHLKKVFEVLRFVRLYSLVEEKRISITLTKNDLKKYDYIFIHDLRLIPLFKGFEKKVIFDAREYYPQQCTEDKLWRKTTAIYFDHWCKKYLPLFRHRITVSESMAEAYARNYQLKFEVFPSYPLIEFSEHFPTDIKGGEKIRIIHHGGAQPNRNIEKFVELAQYLDDKFHVYLMLTDAVPDYLRSIQKLAAGKQNLTVIPPVKFEEIIPFISKFDIGLHFLEGQTNQHPISLPNKYFEFVNAGLMVCVSGSREMVNYTKRLRNGLAFEGVTDLLEVANALNSLTVAEINKYKSASEKAKQELTFEKIVPTVEKMMSEIS